MNSKILLLSVAVLVVGLFAIPSTLSLQDSIPYIMEAR